MHSAPDIFQSEMEKILDKIPDLKVRSDNILISGKNDDEHLENVI